MIERASTVGMRWMIEGVERVQHAGQVLKNAIACFAAAKSDIDELRDLLGYFTSLGDCGKLRDFAEVRANLLKSRALLSTQEKLMMRLTRAAAGLADLVAAGASGAAADERNEATSLIAVPPPQVPAQQEPCAAEQVGIGPGFFGNLS